jgi:hypothetical protein
MVDVEISGPAVRYIRVLKDFGHLTDQAADELAVALADHGVVSGLQRVGLADARRVAAVMLWKSESTVLAEDWPYLFS